MVEEESGLYEKIGRLQFIIYYSKMYEEKGDMPSIQLDEKKGLI